MAIDIMQTLVGFLCPTYSSQSTCQQFINTPSHQVLQPFGPMLYFLFFPTVFLILLIYIGTKVILRGEAASYKGLRLLLAVAVFIWIVIQGWYPLILVIGELWFILLPFIFILFFIVRHFGHGGGGGGGMTGAGGGILGYAKDITIGRNTAVDPREKKVIEDEIKEINAAIKVLEDRLETIKSDREREPIQREISALLNKRTFLQQRLKISKG